MASIPRMQEMLGCDSGMRQMEQQCMHGEYPLRMQGMLGCDSGMGQMEQQCMHGEYPLRIQRPKSGQGGYLLDTSMGEWFKGGFPMEGHT